MPQQNILVPKKTPITKIHHYPKKAPRNTKSKPKPKSNLNLITINACKNSLLMFEQSPGTDVVKDMIDGVVALNSHQLFSKNTSNNELILEIKTNLCTKIREYCNRHGLVDPLNNKLYFSAVKANIITLNDIFIIEMIKQDNEDYIQEMLSSSLITDSTKIKLLSNDKLNYTLVEWCVYFNAVKCFKRLLNNKFSLDYLDEENSPFLMLLTNCAKAIKFSTFLTSNAFDILKLRLLEILAKSEKSASADTLKWIKIKKQQIDILEQMCNLFRKNQKCKLVEFAQLDFNRINPQIMEAYLHDTDAQEAYLGFLEHLYHKMKNQLDLLLKEQRLQKLNGKGVTEIFNDWARTLNSMTVEDALSEITGTFKTIICVADLKYITPITNAFNNLTIQGRNKTTIVPRGSSSSSADPDQKPKNL